MGLGDWLAEQFKESSKQPTIVNGRGVRIHFDQDKVLDNPVAHGVEKTMQGIDWVYSNAVSQPIATAALQSQRQDGSAFFSAAEWVKAWHAAEHVSAGQALALMPYSAPTVEDVVNSPLHYYVPPKSALPAGWDQIPYQEQQRILKEAGMPVDPTGGNEKIRELQHDSAAFKYGSGALDFTSRLLLDPTVIGGKALGALRMAAVVKVRPRGGWAAPQIDKIVNNSRMAKLQDFLWQNRANPMLVNNLDAARKSSLGPRLGAVNALLKSPDEVNDFIRVGMGDVNAQGRLKAKNILAERRITADMSRLSPLELKHAEYVTKGNARMAENVKAEIDLLNETINADTAMVQRYNQILAHKDELDELYVSHWSFGTARQRTAEQLAYRAGAANGFRARALETGEGRGAPAAPTQPGFIKTRLWGVGDFFATPVTLVRGLTHAHPNGYMHIDNGRALEADSINELQGQVARIPGLGFEMRQNLVNRYLKTQTEAERREFLIKLENMAGERIAAKYGLSPKQGRDLVEENRKRLIGIVDDMPQYSAAEMPRTGEPPLRVDAFEIDGGIKIEPHTVSRIRNAYTLQDLDAMDKVFSRHSSALRALYESRAGRLASTDWLTAGADYFNHIWKAATLLRLGYIPRVLSDDLASQWARLGTAAMALRTGYGLKNGVTNLAHRFAKPMHQLLERSHLEAIGYADDELARLAPEFKPYVKKQAAAKVAQDSMQRAQKRLADAQARLHAMPTDAPPMRRGAAEHFVRLRQVDLVRARDDVKAAAMSETDAGRLQVLRDQEAHLKQSRADAVADLEATRRVIERASGPKRAQGFTNAPTVNGVPFEPAFGSQRGDYFLKRVSGDEAYDQLFARNKDVIHGNLMRSYDHGARPISAIDNEEKHAAAWAHAINAQIVGDELQRKLVAGWTEQQAVRWLKTNPAGMAYWKRLNLKTTPYERVVAGAKHEVDDYLPLPEIREQALTPEGVTPDFLREALPKPDHRPTVHMANLGPSRLHHERALDRVIESVYKTLSTIPANRMSRHPLFNQMYEGHLKTIVAQREKQGLKTATVKDVEAVTETARRLALRDTRRLVFDIAHRSDAAVMLRFMSPFFSATTEAFQRWGRVIADRPEVVGYAARFYNTPAYLGSVQDQDGNHIFGDGTYVDPVTKKRELASKDNRFIVFRMPKAMADSALGVALGVERSSGNAVLSQNSINMVTQGDPWFSPGVGPIVQIPVNEFVKDKMDDAELARKLGILPYGPATGETMASRALRQAAPATLRHFLTAYDTSDYRYQQVKAQIMQRAIFEHQQLGKRMLTAQEIADQTENYWLFSAASAFLQPMATQRKDAYQFYRDQYNNLRRANPQTADQEFLNRFGEDYFIFAQAMSESHGLQATKKTVELSQKYAGLLAQHPEMGSLIIGPEGKGPFSPEAYAYQLNTPLVPGDSEMQRRRLTAEEALKENQRRLGWAKFSSTMNRLTSELHNAGFASFDDDGAEALRDKKRTYVKLFSTPTYPDGTPNPYYNEAWAEDFNTYDPMKYERMMPALTAVAHSDLAQLSSRSDLRVLQEYLTVRRQVVQELATREAGGGAKMLRAKENADLAAGWGQYVDSLIERDTRFGDLYHRYLSRDLGVDAEDLADEGEATQ